MKTCVLCRCDFKKDDPAILYIDRYGTERFLCPECEALLDKAAGDTPEKDGAVEEIVRLSSNLRDPEAAEVLKQVISGELSAEETPEDEEAAKQWEEENGTAEKEPERKVTVWDYLPFIIAFTVLGAFAVWFCFFR